MLKIAFGWGFAPDPTGGAHSAPPDPLAALKGPLRGRVRKRKGREGKGEGRREEGKRGREGREGREGEGKDRYLTPSSFFTNRTLVSHQHDTKHMKACGSYCCTAPSY
jgi:hypothetical protein